MSDVRKQAISIRLGENDIGNVKRIAKRLGVVRYFELDAFRLAAIINDQAKPESQVDREDIAILTMKGFREEYLQMRLGCGEAGAAPTRSLRHYLYDKYVYRNGPHAATASRESHSESAIGDDRALTPEGAAHVLRPKSGLLGI